MSFAEKHNKRRKSINCAHYPSSLVEKIISPDVSCTSLPFIYDDQMARLYDLGLISNEVSKL